MESSPNSSSEDKSESKGNGKTSREAARFALFQEAQLEPAKKEAPKILDALTAAPEASDASPAEVAPEEATETNLGPQEQEEAIRGLAQVRGRQLAEAPAADTPEDAQVEAVAADFVARTEETGHPELAAETVIDQIEAIEPEAAADEIIEAAPEVIEPETEDDPSEPSTPLVPPAGAGTPPPSTPLPPSGPTVPFGAPLPFGAAPAAPVAAPQPNVFSEKQVEQISRKNFDDGLVVGGVVGYLLGRRRGRKKAEKRLKPVQEKLEKQVTALKKELDTKEESVRDAVVQKQRETARAVAAKRPEKALERQVLPLPEAIGHALVAHEAPIAIAVAGEQIRRQPEQRNDTPEKVAIEKKVQTMDRQELLQTSEKILVEGANLRQIYETNLVGEKALRRLVAEHLKGGNVAKLLQREILEKQIDFERDPKLRDKGGATTLGGGSMKNREAVSNLIAQTGVVALALQADKAVLLQKPSMPTKTESQSKSDSRNTADIALVTLIFVLVAAIGYFVAN